MPIDAVEIFAELLNLGDEARTARLSEVGDEALRARLVAMLAVDTDDHRLAPHPEHGVAEIVLQGLGGMEPPIPEHLGDFRVLRELGRGGMGVVYEAQERHPPRRVALKTLQTGMVDGRAVEQFERECVAMASVDHGAVPRVHRLFEVDARPVMVMELVRGQPFLEAVKGMSFDDRIRLLIELARAIDEVHRAGIVHRDLKPSNLLIARGGAVRIIDFGIAWTGGAYVAGSGTPAYMPPEQRSGATPDLRNDVYSLGAIAVQVLCGDAALGHPTAAVPTAAERPHEGDTVALSPTLPASLAAVLSAAVEQDVSKRTGTAAALADALEGWLEAELLRMLSTAWPEVGPAGAGAVRRRAVDSTLAVMRRTLEGPPGSRGVRPTHQLALQRLVRWLDEGIRCVSVYGLPGTEFLGVLDQLLDRVGEGLALRVDVEEGPLLPVLAAHLKVPPVWRDVEDALRGLGAAVIGVRGRADLAHDIARTTHRAPDVRWVLASGDRAAEDPFRPLQVLGVDPKRAAESVRQRLAALGIDADPGHVDAAVARVDAMPGWLDPLVDQGVEVGIGALADRPLEAWGGPWAPLVDRVRALSPAEHAALVSLSVLPRLPKARDAAAVLGPRWKAVDGLVRGALVRRTQDEVVVPAVVLEAVRGLASARELSEANARWLGWLNRTAAAVGEDWVHCRPGMDARLDDIALHVAAALPQLDAEDLQEVAAHLADGLSILGHLDVRVALDEAVLAVTPDPLVSRHASMAWVHASMRKRHRGDMSDVPTLRAIRLATDDSDGNLLSQVAHVEASRYAPGNQDPVVAIMRHTWSRLRAGHQEAWGAWMVAAQAPISLGMGLEGTELLALAEDAVASIPADAPDLARFFARQALCFAWIDFGRLAAGARLGSRVTEDLDARGLHRLASSLSTYVGKAWYQLENYPRAEHALRRAVDKGTRYHPPHALQWLALMDIERGDTLGARRHLREAERRMPIMEHGLLHHHRMCEALRAHADGELVEARQLYRSLGDERLSMSARRLGVALAALVMLAADEATKDGYAERLMAEARRHPDAWPAVEIALGPDHVPAGHSGQVTPMLRILLALSAKPLHAHPRSAPARSR